MDGNTSAKHMENAGQPNDVDIFRDDVHLRPGEHEGNQVDKVVDCTENWKAANTADEDTICVFEQTGIFLSACRHGIVQTVVEMQRSGEL